MKKKRIEDSVLWSFSEPQGEGSLNASPELRERVRRHIAWQKESQKMHWVLGKPVTMKKKA